MACISLLTCRTELKQSQAPSRYQKFTESSWRGNSGGAAYIPSLTYRLCRFCYGELEKLPTFFLLCYFSSRSLSNHRFHSHCHPSRHSEEFSIYQLRSCGARDDNFNELQMSNVASELGTFSRKIWDLRFRRAIRTRIGRAEIHLLA